MVFFELIFVVCFFAGAALFPAKGLEQLPLVTQVEGCAVSFSNVKKCGSSSIYLFWKYVEKFIVAYKSNHMELYVFLLLLLSNQWITFLFLE